MLFLRIGEEDARNHGKTGHDNESPAQAQMFFSPPPPFADEGLNRGRSARARSPAECGALHSATPHSVALAMPNACDAMPKPDAERILCSARGSRMRKEGRFESGLTNSWQMSNSDEIQLRSSSRGFRPRCTETVHCLERGEKNGFDNHPMAE